MWVVVSETPVQQGHNLTHRDFNKTPLKLKREEHINLALKKIQSFWPEEIKIVSYLPNSHLEYMQFLMFAKMCPKFILVFSVIVLLACTCDLYGNKKYRSLPVELNTCSM